MDDLKKYYMQQAERLPETGLSVEFKPKRRMHPLARTAIALAAVLALSATVFAAEEIVSYFKEHSFYNIETGKQVERPSEPSISADCQALIDRLSVAIRPNIYVTVSEIPDADVMQTSIKTAVIASIVKNPSFTNSQQYCDAVNGFSFGVIPLDALPEGDSFLGMVMHGIGDLPIREWEEDGYLCREYEQNTDDAVVLWCTVHSGDKLVLKLDSTHNVFNTAAFPADAEVQKLDVEGFDNAMSGYSAETGETWLVVSRDLTDSIFQSDTYTLSSETLTLDELVELAGHIQ